MTKPTAMTVAAAPSKFADVLTLAKVRLNALVVLTTAGGYYMAAPGHVDPVALAIACLGTAFVAGGAAAINQVQERDLDLLMDRTRLRPVPDGRMAPGEALTIAGGLTVAGLVMLGIGSNWLAASVALLTLLIYVLAYTPLKRRSSLSTVIGAIPGALPPLVGWAAARGTIDGVAPWALFLLMFLWQLPHFLAIAWMYREDYARAGLPMLPVIDRTGALTGRQVVLWTATLLPISQLPFLVGMTTGGYAIGGLVLGLLLLVAAVRFAIQRTNANARALFYGTITYLPLLWVLMAFSRR